MSLNCFYFESLLSKLKQFSGESFVVYGYDKEQQEDNLLYRPFSKQRFLDDLASSKAVIATAGFTLITESLYLGKPYLALPMKGQFEQVLNALMLDELGYGKASFTLSDDDITDFLNNLSQYTARLQDYPHEGNSRILSFIDSLLDDDGKKCHELVNQ